MNMVDDFFIQTLIQNNSNRQQYLPDKEKVAHFIEALHHYLFIPHPATATNAETLRLQLQQLRDDFIGLIQHLSASAERKTEVATNFFSAFPILYEALLKDAQAILNTDPAARTLEEVLAAYPGFFAVMVYRLSHQIHNQALPVLARFFSEYAHSRTGIDIHPAAIIGNAFVIDHGTGIVIGETTTIGNNVKLYQGVTLGALAVSKDKASIKRHPTIQDDVVIYAGATILGGDTIIGRASIVGGNVWLTYSIPSNSVVYHKSEIHVKDANPFPEPLNFVI